MTTKYADGNEGLFMRSQTDHYQTQTVIMNCKKRHQYTPIRQHM